MTQPGPPFTRPDNQTVYTVVPHSRSLIRVPFGSGWLQVPKWNRAHESKAHTFIKPDMDTVAGHPQGSLFYQHNASGKTIRIGVRWDPKAEALECRYVHETAQRTGRDRDAVDADEAELDARARLAALAAVNAVIAGSALTPDTAKTVVASAGFGLVNPTAADAGETESPEDGERPANGFSQGFVPSVPGEGEAVITRLRQGEGGLMVNTWADNELPGWTPAGYDLTLANGHPFGVVNYQHKATGNLLRVGVQWNPNEYLLEFVALHPTEPRLTNLTDGVAHAVRDARGRVGHLMALHAEIAQIVTGQESTRQLLNASGFGDDIEYVLEDEPS